MKKFLENIPVVLSSNISIFIFLFLFIYLFLLGIAGIFLPKLAPSSNMQLILGNYTNVTSALGAAIAAGSATAAHKSIKKLHDKHDDLAQSVSDLHDKHDKALQSLSDLHDKVDKINN